MNSSLSFVAEGFLLLYVILQKLVTNAIIWKSMN